jgi:hypothetical protein
LPWSLHSAAGAPNYGAEEKPATPVGMTEVEERNSPSAVADKLCKMSKKRGGGKAAPICRRLLACRDEVAAAVLLPAAFIGFSAEGLFLAVADGAEIGGRNAQIDEVLLDGVGTAIAESEVVLGGAAFVAVAFDDDLCIRIALEERSGFLERCAGVRTDIGLVEVEVSVADFLIEEFGEGGSLGRRRRRRRCVDGDADGGIGAAAGTAGGDGIGGGVGRGDGGGALRSDGADFGSDGDVGGVGGGPGELGGFAFVDGSAIGGDADGGFGGGRWWRWRGRRNGLWLLIASGHEEKRRRSDNEKRTMQRGVRVIHSCPPRHYKLIVERNPPEGESYHRRQGSGNISPYDILYVWNGKSARKFAKKLRR